VELIGKEDKDVDEEEERVIGVGSMRLDNYESSVGKSGQEEKETERTLISTQEPKTVQIYTTAFEILRIWTCPD
jgi:hypothetical protein